MKNKNFKYLLCITFLFIFSCDDDNGNPVEGCPDVNACNTHEDSTVIDDGSCIYDSEGCTDNTGDTCEYDCAGDCVVSVDECGECGGDDSSCEDCLGVPNGDAVEDNCGTCDNNSENDCEADCNGLFEGEEGYNADAVIDCLGVCDGDAVIDDCDVCNGGNASQDCAGVCDGSSVEDECGECGGNGPEENYDCNGDVLYSAIQDVFNANCTGCHGSSGGLNLTSYNNLMSNDVIDPGNHQSSYLWQRVDNGSMPPGNNPDLTQAEVDLIAAWIDQGASSIDLISQWIID